MKIFPIALICFISIAGSSSATAQTPAVETQESEAKNETQEESKDETELETKNETQAESEGRKKS